MSQDLFHHSIVVVGHMNPAIHTPEYYQILGWIDDAEQRYAIEQPSLLRSRAAAQFALPDIAVVCGDDRWEIKTTNVAATDRIRKIACAVWEKLDATPVSAFGLNYNYHRKVSHSNVAALLHQLVSRALGYDISGKRTGGTSGALRYSYGPDHDQVTVSIEPSIPTSPEGVYVGINANHVIQGTGHFNLSEKLTRAYPEDTKTAQTHLQAVLESINAAGKVAHGS